MEQWRMKVEYGEIPISETLNDRVPGHVELNLAVQHITSACKVFDNTTIQWIGSTYISLEH